MSRPRASSDQGHTPVNCGEPLLGDADALRNPDQGNGAQRVAAVAPLVVGRSVAGEHPLPLEEVQRGDAEATADREQPERLAARRLVAPEVAKPLYELATQPQCREK